MGIVDVARARRASRLHAVVVLAVAVMLAVPLAAPGIASADQEPTPTSQVEPPPSIDPAMWCRPVVPAWIDPEPLGCWLDLSADVTTSSGTAVPLHEVSGLNLGDLPAFSDIDADHIAATLAEFEARIEAEQREAARQAAAAAQRNSGRSPAQPTGPPCGVVIGAPLTAEQQRCIDSTRDGGTPPPSGGGSSGGGICPEVLPNGSCRYYLMDDGSFVHPDELDNPNYDPDFVPELEPMPEISPDNTWKDRTDGLPPNPCPGSWSYTSGRGYTCY